MLVYLYLPKLHSYSQDTGAVALGLWNLAHIPPGPFSAILLQEPQQHQAL